jgi:hypothetical protein
VKAAACAGDPLVKNSSQDIANDLETMVGALHFTQEFRVVARDVEMNDKYEQCLRLRDQAAGYIERFLQERGTTVEMEYPEQAVRIWYRPKDGKTRSLTIIAYWEQGFYVWVVWKGEDGEREDVHVGIGNDPAQRKEFPELDHLLVEL